MVLEDLFIGELLLVADPNSTFDTVDVVGIVTAGSFVTDLIPSNGTGREILY